MEASPRPSPEEGGGFCGGARGGDVGGPDADAMGTGALPGPPLKTKRAFVEAAGGTKKCVGALVGGPHTLYI